MATSNDHSYGTDGSYGMQTLSEPKDALADIVFVHGLTGNRKTTWTDTKTGVFWPVDLLPAVLEQDELGARIMTFGYDADVVGLLETASSNRLRDHGKSLAEERAMLRLRSHTSNRPPIFVTHDLGGLVCEQALLISRDSADAHLTDLLEATHAIAFLGTPHHGSDKAGWTKVLRNFANIFRYTNKDLLRVLEPGSEVLAGLEETFHVMLDKRDQAGKRRIHIFCFYEEIGVLGIGQIVPMYSAVLSRYGNKSIHADHVGMTKFESAQSQGFQDVSGRLWLWVDMVKRASQQPPAGVDREELGQRRTQHFGNVHAGGSVYQGNENVYAINRS
ncbi:MAG: hypothetical protein M1837_002501 [Sclerophora amabilis]|nr:MAG: hypothetical protein M1837_002501 [Sclerophora amabilis]